MLRPLPDPDALAADLAGGDRAALAQAITLVESRKPEHRALASDLLTRLPPLSTETIRIAVSGSPGAGKSTLIEALGVRWVEAGRRVAVLAVDPSSQISRGSILGDKSRMERLARHPEAFVRPSPTSGHLGGVALRTRETIRLVEAAGFTHVIVETVGVGQSETTAKDLADLFVFVAQPASGDDLQGIKRGFMEHADLFAVTKRDLLPDAVAATVRSLRSALSILPPPTPDALPPHERVLSLSSTTGEGIDVLSDRIDVLNHTMRTSGQLGEQRRNQAVAALEPAFIEALVSHARMQPGFADAWSEAEESVRGGATVEEVVERLTNRA